MPKRSPEPEVAFASWLEDALDVNHWRWYHVYDSRRDKAGFPDYCAVKGVWVLFIEIKGVDVRGQPGKLSPAQIVWKDALTPQECPVPECDAIHAESFAWWPEDRDEIMERLGR